MSYLCKGMEYYEFNAKIGGVDKRLYVARIAPSALPFIISSITNDPVSVDAGRPFLHRRRRVFTVGAKELDLSSKSRNLSARYQGRNYTLRPVWVSNGIFFNPFPDVPAYILGPVVHNDTALADPPPAIVPDIAKRRRWYFSHLHTEPFDNTIFSWNVADVLAPDFATIDFSLIGGAGCLISGGQVKTENDWISPDEGAFSRSQFYSCGPVIAQTGGTRPIRYLILPESDVPWKDMAPYLRNSFGAEISRAANLNAAIRSREGRRRPDPAIRDALVYDGGGSKQLWIHNRRPSRVALRPLRPVPHYICLWGRV